MNDNKSPFRYELAAESKVFEQDHHVFDAAGKLVGVFGDEESAMSYVAVPYAEKAFTKICLKMQEFKTNTSETVDSVLGMCRDFNSVKTFGDFGETENLTRPNIVHY